MYFKLYSDSLYVSCVNEAARYHTAKWPNRTYMYVFQHRSKKAETPLWMGKLKNICLFIQDLFCWCWIFLL